MSESIQRLEEKVAYLERHVTEQDKAMLELADDLARLKRELAAFQDRSRRSSRAGESDESVDERPPHY